MPHESGVYSFSLDATCTVMNCKCVFLSFIREYIGSECKQVLDECFDGMTAE